MLMTQELPKLMDDAGYAVATRRLEELKLRAQQLEEALNAPTPGRQEREEELARRARLVISGGDLARELHTRAQSNADLVHEELRIVRKAIRLQKETVQAELLRASREACARVKDAHAEAVRRLGVAIRNLGEAVAAEKTFRNHMRDEGFYFTGELRPMPFQAGDLTEEYSVGSMWLRDAKQHGLI